MGEQASAWLGDNVPHSRLQHILRVEQTSALLASHHDVDVEKAAAAGLMHDLAKNFTPQQLLEIAAGEGLELDGAIAIASPPVPRTGKRDCSKRSFWGSR